MRRKASQNEIKGGRCLRLDSPLPCIGYWCCAGSWWTQEASKSNKPPPLFFCLSAPFPPSHRRRLMPVFGLSLRRWFCWASAMRNKQSFLIPCFSPPGRRVFAVRVTLENMKFAVSSNRFGCCMNFRCWIRELLYYIRVFLAATKMPHGNKEKKVLTTHDSTKRRGLCEHLMCKLLNCVMHLFFLCFFFFSTDVVCYTHCSTVWLFRWNNDRLGFHGVDFAIIFVLRPYCCTFR